MCVCVRACVRARLAQVWVIGFLRFSTASADEYVQKRAACGYYIAFCKREVVYKRMPWVGGISITNGICPVFVYELFPFILHHRCRILWINTLLVTAVHIGSGMELEHALFEHNIALHYVKLHYITSYYILLHHVRVRLHHVTLRDNVMLHCIALLCHIALCYKALPKWWPSFSLYAESATIWQWKQHAIKWSSQKGMTYSLQYCIWSNRLPVF